MSETTAAGKKPIAKKTPWRIRRYYFYIAFTAISLILPWIEINGNHFFLLSFDKLKLHLAFVHSSDDHVPRYLRYDSCRGSGFLRMDMPTHHLPRCLP